VDLQPRRRRDPELVLQKTELHALEARRRHEEFAELEEIQRRHRLEHVELREQQALDLHDAPEVRDRTTDLALPDARLPEGREHRVELPEDLLEPQLVRLMDDDEQHLVVDGGTVLLALEFLALEQAVQLQVLAVVNGRSPLRHALLPDSVCVQATKPGAGRRGPSTRRPWSGAAVS